MNNESGIPILLYHRLVDASELQKTRDRYVLAKSVFEEQIKLLVHLGYSTITLDDLVAWTKGMASLPIKPVIITFDDGNESDYTLAYPILRRYGFTATFFIVVDSVGSPGTLTWEQMKEMSCNGMAIQSHTLSHPYLTKLSREQIRAELGESKAMLESKIGKPVHFLAIPGGMYNGTVKRIAKETGYLAVVTSSMGINNVKSDLYSLKRIAIKRGITLSQFALYLEGKGMFWGKSMQFLTNMLKRILGIENYASIRRKLLRLK